MTKVPSQDGALSLSPVSFVGLELVNRIAVAPMTRVSSTAEGVPTPRMASYYRAFAEGGFALVMTEGTYTDGVYSQGYANQPGLVNESQVEGWRVVVKAVHEAGGFIIAQLMHAGALSQVLERTAGPSALRPMGEKLPEYGGEGAFPVPKAMAESEIQEAIKGFANAAANARLAGFDGVEAHGANGYLVDQFITAYTNERVDRYGGAVGARARFAADVVRAVRGAVGGGFPIGIRLSQGKVNDHGYRWPGGKADAEAIFGVVAEAGPDYLHIASEGRDWRETAQIEDGLTITQLAKRVTGLHVITNGGMHDPEQAEMVLREGLGDVVALGRGALANPDWPARLRDGREINAFDKEMLQPKANLQSADDWHGRIGTPAARRARP